MKTYRLTQGTWSSAAACLLLCACSNAAPTEETESSAQVDAIPDEYLGPRCLRPEELHTVVEPITLPLQSVIYKVEVDEKSVYFESFDRLYRVPVAGGAMEEIFYAKNGFSSFMREEDVLIVAGSTVSSLPKGGGSAVELGHLPAVPSGWLLGMPDLVVDGNTLYMKSDSGFLGLPSEEERVAQYFAIDLDSFEVTTLATTPIGVGKSFVKADDGLYVATWDPSVPENMELNVQPALLYRIPLAGGEPELIETTFGDETRFGFNVVGADTSAVFVNAFAVIFEELDLETREGVEAWASYYERHGVYRVDLGGGPATQILAKPIIFQTSLLHAQSGDGSILVESGSVYSVVAGSLEADELVCLARSSVLAATVSDSSVFLALWDHEDRASIVRFDL